MEPERDANDPEHQARVADQVAALADELFEMARAGNATTLGAYVDAGAPVDLANEAGDTLVMLAAYHGHPSAVRSLVARGADVNRANDKGQTPLAGAVFKGVDDVVRILLEAGADPHGGQPSAVDCARMFGKDEYLELFSGT